MQSLGTNWIVVSHFFPLKIREFLSSGPEGWIFKPSQEFYFVTLKTYANFGLELNDAFQICPPPKKIYQFLSSRRKVPKFQTLFLCFVWKVNNLNHKTFTGVLFCDTEQPCKPWAKTESCFPNQFPKNWSISFQQERRVQISCLIAFFCQKSKLFELKIFTGVLFCDTEAPCKLWAKTECCFPNKHPKNFSICSERAKRIQMSDFISFFCLKSKLPEQNDLHTSFTLRHGRTMQNLGQNWILLSKSAQKRFDQFVSSGRKVSKFLILLVSFMWKVNCLNQKVWQEFHFVTEKSHGKFGSKLNPAFQISPHPSQKKLENFFPVGKKGPNFKLFYSVKGHFLRQKNIDRCFILWYCSGPDFATLFSFYPNFACPSVSQNNTLLKSYASSNLPFTKNKPIKLQIWILFISPKHMDQFLGVWFGKKHSVLAQCLQGPSVSQNETPVKEFWLGHFTFQTKETNKI